MSENAFKPGDVVRLRSGGPAMTVRNIASDQLNGEIVCVWFNGGQLSLEEFLPVELEPVRSEQADAPLSPQTGSIADYLQSLVPPGAELVAFGGGSSGAQPCDACDCVTQHWVRLKTLGGFCHLCCSCLGKGNTPNEALPVMAAGVDPADQAAALIMLDYRENLLTEGVAACHIRECYRTAGNSVR